MSAPVPDLGGVFVLNLAKRPAVSAVRKWVAEVVPEVTGDQLQDLQLVVTELVSNAYDHGRRPLSLRLRMRADRVRVEVEDASPDLPVLGHSRIADSRGRGLLLVAALTAEWGHSFHSTGKTVWAHFPHETH